MAARGLGWLLLVAGLGLIAWGLLRPSWRLERQPLNPPPQVGTAFRIERLERLRWRHREGTTLSFEVARFRDRRGEERRALWPENPKAWEALAGALARLEEGAILLAWWHHSGRLLLFAGLESACPFPPEEAFPEESREIWREVAGRFAEGDCLRRLARWLLLPEEEALAEIGSAFGDRPVYLLVSAEELLHLEEIARLAGRPLPLEVRRLPLGEDFHGRIAAAARWGMEGGRRYLPLRVPGGIALFRYLPEGKGTPFLFRLLPFLPPEPPPLEPVFESRDHLLRLYRLR